MDKTFSKTTLRVHHGVIDRLRPYALVVHRWQWLTGMRPVLEGDHRSFAEMTVRRGTPAVDASVGRDKEAGYGTTTL